MARCFVLQVYSEQSNFATQCGVNVNTISVQQSHVDGHLSRPEASKIAARCESTAPGTCARFSDYVVGTAAPTYCQIGMALLEQMPHDWRLVYQMLTEFFLLRLW